jgi:ABC-type Fe3+-hydroxamate transport system substrate-binding protein
VPGSPARILAPVLAALAVFALGCQESGFDERKETARPLKVQHVLGETKVPGQAQRPLTMTLDTLDDTLALGVHPSRAAVPAAKLPPYLRGPGRGVTLMRPVTAADLPAVDAVHADLILGSNAGQGKLYDDLSRIAPTVIIEGTGGQWKLDLRLVGEGVGRTNDAEQLLIDYDREAADARRAIRAAATSAGRKPRVAVVRASADGLRFAKRNSFAGIILTDAGVKQVNALAGADAILLSGAPGARSHLKGSVTRVDGQLWWGAGGALAARAALADLQRALAG